MPAPIPWDTYRTADLVREGERWQHEIDERLKQLIAAGARVPKGKPGRPSTNAPDVEQEEGEAAQ